VYLTLSVYLSILMLHLKQHRPHLNVSLVNQKIQKMGHICVACFGFFLAFILCKLGFPDTNLHIFQMFASFPLRPSRLNPENLNVILPKLFLISTLLSLTLVVLYNFLSIRLVFPESICSLVWDPAYI
jgi:hypothetical protein